MFIWTKRQLVSEMLRLTDQAAATATVIAHTHNERVWSHSHGQALPPDAYSDLFEILEPRLFAERRLLDELVGSGEIDLSHRHDQELLEADPALVIVATKDHSLFRAYASALEPVPGSVLRINPLYEEAAEGGGVRLRLRFPSPDYEDEFGESRRYLPESLFVDAETLADIAGNRRSEAVMELVRRRVVLGVPDGYFERRGYSREADVRQS
jgi:hypothetical protein